MRYSIAFIDIIFLLTSLAAFFILSVRRKQHLRIDIRLILCALLALNLLYGLCLFLEWMNIANFIESYEDLIGAMVPMMWAFFFYAILQNIAGADLKKSEDRYRRLFEGSNDLIIIHRLGKIIDVNRKVCDVLGYSREQLLKMSIPDLHPEHTRQKATEEVVNLEMYADKILDGNLVKANGELIYVEVSTSVIDLEKGIGQGILRDVTERKKAEKELRLSEEKFSKAFHSSPDSITITLLSTGQLIEMNSGFERIFGISREEALNQTSVALGFWNSAEERNRMVVELMKSGKIRDMEVKLNTRSGKTITCLLSGELMDIHDHKYMLSIIRDITGRKRAEAERKNLEHQLRRTQKMEAIGTLAGGIAHDFNNILSIIFGFTDLALMDIDSPQKAASDLEELKKAASRAKELIKQILTISRQTEQEKQPVRVSLIVTEALKLLRSTIPSSIEMKNDIISGSTVFADATQIHQIILNLCTNAYHAMGDKAGTLSVSVKDVLVSDGDIVIGSNILPGMYVKIEVSDTGHGMDERTKERIFEPYFTTKKLGEGTGLGLAVVHGIVESHEGIINVYSEPGVGTSFHIYLPVFDGESVPGETQNRIQYNMRGKERILFVDDEKIITDIASDTLSRYGYSIKVFKSSREALEEFQKAPSEYDMIITDMTMPGMSGIDLAEKIRELSPDIPIILCSGYNRLVTLQKTKDMKIEFIAKPIIMSEVIRTIRLIFEKGNNDK